MAEAVTIWLVSIWGLEGALGCTAATAGVTELGAAARSAAGGNAAALAGWERRPPPLAGAAGWAVTPLAAGPTLAGEPALAGEAAVAADDALATGGAFAEGAAFATDAVLAGAVFGVALAATGGAGGDVETSGFAVPTLPMRGAGAAVFGTPGVAATGLAATAFAVPASLALADTALSCPARDSWAALAESRARSDVPEAFMPNLVCLNKANNAKRTRRQGRNIVCAAP